MTPRIAWALVLVLIGPGPASGQDPGTPQTRAEALRQAREEKQRNLEPYRPNGFEQAVRFVEGSVVPWFQRDTIYAKFGALAAGSGFAYGAGYRNSRVIGTGGRLDLWAAGSAQKYWAYEIRATYPELVPGVVNADFYGRRYNYTQEEFHGLGPDTDKSNRSSVKLRGLALGGNVGVRLMPFLRVGGGLDYMRPRAEEGTEPSLPSIADLYDEQTAPGLFGEPTFIRSSTFVEVDYRQPINARRGGWYRLDLGRYHDREDGAFSFTRVDVELRQYLTLVTGRVLAGRVHVATTDLEAGQHVPFYLMPALGGSYSLRGFRANRFHGQHSILLQGEYRWELWSGLEAALFYDAGKVTERRSDLNLRDLESAYGFGFRANTDTGVIMRVDAAFGSRDGRHLYVVFGSFF
jgi:outer membrane protein assembly factor BamA